MFTPARIVIVDDTEKHLWAIRDAVESLGSSCVCIHYSEAEDPPSKPFERARIIFMDLNLRSRQPSPRQHFGEIQRLLVKLVPPDGGPFVLIIWTDWPEQVADLRDYLRTHLTHRNQHARPLEVLGLPKMEFIDHTSGVAADPEALRERIAEQLDAVPGLAAMLRWETDIIQAGDRVLHDVAAMAMTEPAPDVSGLAAVLRRLASETVGEPNVLQDPQGAIHSALLPLLQDHVQYETVMDERSPDVWRVTLAGTDDLPEMSRGEAATLNAQLHLGDPDGPLQPSTWGAICHLEPRPYWRAEFGVENDVDFADKLAKQLQTLKGGATVSAEDLRPLQIRIGASCDYAQQTDGPIPYVLGLFVPLPTPKSKDIGALELAANSTCWLSPMLRMGEWGDGQILVNPRYVRSCGRRKASRFKAAFRLREQLLMELIAAVAHHGARPGIVRFTGRDPAADG